MCQNCLVKTIHHAQHHFGWDNSLSPVLHVASGSQLEFHCLDAANGWFNAGSTAADIPTLPFDKLNPVSGPVYVEGAQPGDALKVTLESFRPSGFGWTANIPGFGLLADQFSDPALTLWQYDRQGLTPCAFGRYGRVPLKPFAGTLGVAPAARDAVSYTIDALCREQGMSAEEAYMLCSVCGDLRISEIVDRPNWVVSFYFPNSVFN